MARDLTPLALDPDLDPWERQPRESPRNYAQFVIFRDMGRLRTLRKVAETLTLSGGHVRTVAAAMAWRRRAEQWDLHVDALYHAELALERRKAAKDDATLLHAMLQKIAARIRTLNPEAMEVPDLLRGLDIVLKHRRALFGDPVTTIALTGPAGDPLTVQVADFAGMPAEQRQRAILALADDVRRRAEAAGGGGDDDG